MPPSSSIVRALTIRVALLLAGCVVTIGATSFFAAKSRIYDIYDRELVTGTALLHTLVKEELEHHAANYESNPQENILHGEDIVSFKTYAPWRTFRIWMGGRVLGYSEPNAKDGPAPTAAGFIDWDAGGGTWRGYHLASDEIGMSIMVAEPLAERDAVVNAFALTLLAPLLLVIAVGLALIWLTLMGGLGALRRLSGALHERSGKNLAPLDPTQWPRDLTGIVTAINSLLDRVDRSFRQTLRFTDHAAHELRTPFASLKLNAQMLQTECNPAEQRELAERIAKGADQGAALVEQLLILTRLDSGGFTLQPTDVNAVAKAVLEELAPVAVARDVRFAFSGATRLTAQAHPTLLKVILRNLIDNAIKQSPRGGEVAVETAKQGAVVELMVNDTGPGIPLEERERVFERFHRIDSDKPGVGLGLSIVKEALAQIGGTIALESLPPNPGLSAIVRMHAAVDIR